MSEISVVVVGSTSISSVVGNGDTVKINVADQTVGGGNGAAATIQAGTVTTIDATQTATVTNVGTAYAAKFNFSLPRGYTGVAGPANSLSIGSVSTGTTAAVSITGSAPSQSLSFVLPLGPTGPANSLSIGSVSTGATATVSISGTAPSQKLSFVLQPGPAGPANSLSIGSVNTGTTAAVTISGSSPSQTLSFVLPQGPAGQAGQAGPANSLSIGSVTTGTTAAVTISGSAPSQTLSFVLPQGPAGTPNSLSIGSVTTGTTAAVSISGSAPSQTLSFVLPQGPQGIQGPQGPVGTANLADETPQPLGTASAGTALTAARADHVHDVGSIQYSSLAGIPSTFTPSAHTHAVSDVTGLQAALDGKQAAGNYAPLVNNQVPSANLPSFVDDVIEYANLAAFAVTGEVGKIFVARDTGKIYRWSGSAYIEISPSPGSTDSVTEGSTNLYFTNARASAAAPVQSVQSRTGAVVLTKSDVGLSNVTNVDATQRSNHTGTQTASTISDFSTEAAKYGPVVSVVGRTGAISLSTSDITGLQTALDAKQAAGNYVTSVNSLYGGVKLAAGTNIAITASGQTITIASTGIGANDVVDGGVYSGRLILSNTVSFTTQPADTTAAFRSATFTSQATTSAGGLSLHYQWQRSDDGGTTWADIYGARSKTLTVSQLTYAADNNDRYRVVASSLAAQSVASNAAKLTIESQGWQQLGATIKGGVSRNNLGISVSVGGSGASTTVAVGESGEIGDLLFSPVRSGVAGSATVYAWNGSSWATKGDPIVGGTFTILGDSYGTKTGSRVAISRDGNFLAVLSREQSGGNVKVYAWSGSAWTQRGSAFEMYVSEIAISDDGASVVTGGPYWGTADRGLVRNYVWNGTAWMQRGGDIFGLSSGSYLGTSVSISADGNTIAAGAPIFGSGRASVYSWTGSTWQEKSYYTGGSNNDRFGQSVSLSADGSKIAVSAPLKSGGAKAGVYSVGSGGSLFSIVGQEVSGGYGLSNVQLSDDGSALSVVGSYTNVLETGNIGWARVYRWSGTAWVASGDDFSGLSSDGSSDGSLASAYVCALSGDGNVLVFGAPLGDGNATDSGLVRIYGYAG